MITLTMVLHDAYWLGFFSGVIYAIISRVIISSIINLKRYIQTKREERRRWQEFTQVWEQPSELDPALVIAQTQ